MEGTKTTTKIRQATTDIIMSRLEDSIVVYMKYILIMFSDSLRCHYNDVRNISHLRFLYFVKYKKINIRAIINRLSSEDSLL